MFIKRRIHRIFRDDGRSLVVAMDHGLGLDVYPELTRPERVLDAVMAGGADAILLTPGIIRQFSSELKSIGVILRVDGGSSQLSSSPECRLLYTVEDALKLGADAVACMGFLGTSLEPQTLENLVTLARESEAWGVPLMAEMLPGGLMKSEARTTENIRLAARIGVELGADFIKTEYVGPPESFRHVTEHCYRPVLILGGEKTADERALFTVVRSSLDVGTAGVVMGRNVWGHTRPKAMVMALRELIHHNATVDEALSIVADTAFV